MKKSEVWLQLVNSMLKNPAIYENETLLEIVDTADALIIQLENRFGDVYQPEDEAPKEKKEICFSPKV